jgi:hypothetical protein
VRAGDFESPARLKLRNGIVFGQFFKTGLLFRPDRVADMGMKSAVMPGCHVINDVIVVFPSYSAFLRLRTEKHFRKTVLSLTPKCLFAIIIVMGVVIAVLRLLS